MRNKTDDGNMRTISVFEKRQNNPKSQQIMMAILNGRAASQAGHRRFVKKTPPKYPNPQNQQSNIRHK